MSEIQQDNGQFKLNMDDEIDESAIAAQVDDLRIEKLSHRMTLITILIPVLIVVVLFMAYMDMKRRVVMTEDTGQLTAQSLSEDLESRFSNLSLGQALVEEKMARIKDETEQSMAKVQVNLKNLSDSLKQSKKSMASRKDVSAAAQKVDKSLENVAQSIETVKADLAALGATIQPRLEQIDQTLSQDKSRVDQIEEKLNGMDASKMDKPAILLAIKLEILKLKQNLKVQIDDIQEQLKALDAKIDKQAAKAAPAPSLSAQPSPPSSSPAPQTSPGTLDEQTIQQ